MRKNSLAKITSAVSLLVMLGMVVMPYMASAQFDPNAGIDSDPTGGKDTSISSLIITVINLLLALAGLVAVVFLIVGGFRYITAGGNEEAVEGAKKTIINAIIGVVVVILSFVIVRVVANAVISPDSVSEVAMLFN